jgi:hypothetical protein
MKKCSTCKKTKAVTDFYKNRTSKDRLQPCCKDCNKTYQKSYREANKDKVKAIKKAWQQANPDKVKAYYETNKDKVKAYYETNKDRIKANVKAYRETNPDKVKASKKAYIEANPDKVKAIKKAWQQANKDKVKAIKKAWEKANPGKMNALWAKRKAQKLKATPPWLTDDHLAEIQEWYTIAKDLQWLSEEPLQVDHIVPLQGKHVCGLHVPWNLQILPKSENISKGNKFPLKKLKF